MTGEVCLGGLPSETGLLTDLGSKLHFALRWRQHSWKLVLRSKNKDEESFERVVCTSRSVRNQKLPGFLFLFLKTSVRNFMKKL